MKKTIKKKIGFIGLGRVGKPMATNILKAGFPLIVYDVRKEPLVEMEKLGAKVASNAKELGQDSDTVIVMVLDYQQVKEVLFSSNGALAGMKSGSTLIIMSTISPLDVKHVGELLRESGVAILDAPITGGISGAEAGTLTIMVGGDSEVLKNNEDVLEAMGQNIRHVGELGMGEVAKMIHQIPFEASVVATVEAMAMAKKLGLNLETVYDIVTHGVGDSQVFRQYGSRIIARDFTPTGCIDIGTKDTQIIVSTAIALGIPLPVSTAVHQVMRMGQSRGFGQMHHSALIKLYEEFGDIKGDE